MKPSRDIQLPPELWCGVLAYVEDLTLWTSCRRVNKLFRTEAEREFAANRIEDLHIHSSARSSRRYLSAPVILKMKAVTGRLVSVDGGRATFLLSVQWDSVRVDNSPLDPDMDLTYEKPGIYGFLHRSLSNSDRNISSRLGLEPELAQRCYFRGFSLDAPLPNLDLDLRVVDAPDSESRISFDWKPLLDGIFSVYAQSQRQAQLEGCTDLDLEVTMAHLREKYKGVSSITVREYCDWITNYGSAPSRNCFQDAYAQRITRFFKNKHLHFEPNLDRNDYHLDEKAWGELEEYMDKCIERRNGAVILRFMSKNNMVIV